jgi:hypothetical protein
MILFLVNAEIQIRVLRSMERAEIIPMVRIKMEEIIEIFQGCLTCILYSGSDVNLSFLVQKIIDCLYLCLLIIFPLVGYGGLEGYDAFLLPFDRLQGRIGKIISALQNFDDWRPEAQITHHILSSGRKTDDTAHGVGVRIVEQPAVERSRDSAEENQILVIGEEDISWFPDGAEFFGEIIRVFYDFYLELTAQKRANEEKKDGYYHKSFFHSILLKKSGVSSGVVW